MTHAKNVTLPHRDKHQQIQKHIEQSISPDGKTLLQISALKIPAKDIIWCITKFLPEIENRKFAIWCARQCKTKIKEIKNYIDVIEKHYIYGTATKEEMDRANWAAIRETGMVSYWAANWAANWVANWAANSAGYRVADEAAERKKQIKKLISIIKELHNEYINNFTNC